MIATIALLSGLIKAQGTWYDLRPTSGATLWKDTAGSETPRGGYRLAVAGTFPDNLYLANGKELLYYSQTTGWRTFVPDSSRQPYPFREPAPLAAAKRPDSLVLWGNWRSRDHGRRWEALPFPSTRFLVYAIGAGGLCLGGGLGETIERSLDSGRTWRTVYQGDATGYVRHLHFGDSGWVFAALHPEGILVSRDRGLNWTPWAPSPARGASLRRIQAMTTTRHPETPGQILWTLHQDPAPGTSILVRNLIQSGRADTVTTLPPDLVATCLSSNATNVIVGGDTRVYHNRGDGVNWALLNVNWSFGGESEFTELHGGGMEFATFAVTGKSLFARYYETGIRLERPAPIPMRQSPLSPTVWFSPGRSSAWFLANGRRVP